MLGIEQGLAALGDEVADGGGDGLAVLVESHVQGGGDVEIVGLADQADSGGHRVQDGGEDVVIVGRPAHAAGHAEGGEGGFCGRGGGEELAESVGFAPGQPPSI